MPPPPPPPAPDTPSSAISRKAGAPRAILTAIATNLAMLGWAYWTDVGLGAVMLFYWIESLALGVGAFLRMILTQPPDAERQRRPLAKKVFLVYAFCVHYGAFTLFHGIMVVMLISEFEMVVWSDALILSLPVLLLAMIALYGIAMPLIDRAQGLLTEPVPNYVFGVYGRVVVLHIGILGAGLLIGLSGQAHAFVFVAVFAVAKIVAETGLIGLRLARSTPTAER